MIEIVEVKDASKKIQWGMTDDTDRMFVFLDGNHPLGTIHFSVRHPHMAELVLLKVSDTISLGEDLIVDGLVRTACHTFLRENIHWMVAENEMVNQYNLLAAFFTPLSAMREAKPYETLTELYEQHTTGHVLKTDMIYKGTCKGD